MENMLSHGVDEGYLTAQSKSGEELVHDGTYGEDVASSGGSMLAVVSKVLRRRARETGCLALLNVPEPELSQMRPRNLHSALIVHEPDFLWT